MAKCVSTMVSQVSKEMMHLEVEFSAGQEVCEDQICLGVIKSIPSCVLTVRQVSSTHWGHWLFRMRAEDMMSGSQPVIKILTFRHILTGQVMSESQEVGLYSPEMVEMMGTTTTTEMTTTTTMSAMEYTAPLEQSVQMKLRPLLQSCLSLGSGLLDLADRDDLLEFIENINCTLH